MPAAPIFFSISTRRFLLLSAKLSVFSWINPKKVSFLTRGGSYWDSSTKIIWNLIQGHSEDNYEFSSAEKRALNTHRHWTV